MKKVLAILLSVLILSGCFATFVSAASLRQLDLAFVVDTTGSMSDDIEEAKAYMSSYVDSIKALDVDYKIAIVDYRDFPERSATMDYPCKVQQDFTSDYGAIINGINGLTIGHGGDTPETVFSALIDGVNALSWRTTAGKAIILIGDAPALDPEPITNYTMDNAINNLKTGSIAEIEDPSTPSPWSSVSSDAVLAPQAGTRSPITLFGIVTSDSSSAKTCFEKLSSGTGGKTYTTSSEVSVSDCVEEIIKTIPDTVVSPDLTIWDKIKAFLLKLWNLLTSPLSLLKKLIPC